MISSLSLGLGVSFLKEMAPRQWCWAATLGKLGRKFDKQLINQVEFTQALTDIIKQFGGIPIDRHNEDFVEIIKRETDGRGVDHILDPISGENLNRSLKVLAMGGKVYSFGMSCLKPNYEPTGCTDEIDPVDNHSKVGEISRTCYM